MSFAKYSTQKISTNVLKAISNLVSVNDTVSELVIAATDGDKEKAFTIAQTLEVLLNLASQDLEVIRNASVTLGRDLSGEFDNKDEIEIDVVKTANGVLF